MSNDGLSFFDLAERRLGWIDRRHAVLAQNVANANTPGYIARDLAPFARSLAQASQNLNLTDPVHIAGAAPSMAALHTLRPAERAPDGNAVSLEAQLVSVADNEGAHALVTNLYHKYLGFFRTVLGK